MLGARRSVVPRGLAVLPADSAPVPDVGYLDQPVRPAPHGIRYARRVGSRCAALAAATETLRGLREARIDKLKAEEAAAYERVVAACVAQVRRTKVAKLVWPLYSKPRISVSVSWDGKAASVSLSSGETSHE